MPKEKEPWQDSSKLTKADENCTGGRPHRLKIVSLTRTDNSDDHIKSEVVYQCAVCKKYHVDRYVYPKRVLV